MKNNKSIKPLDEMISIMTAYKNGKKIESRDWTDKDNKWENATHPCWNWLRFDYRIKSEKTTRPMSLEEIIEWRKNSNGVVLWTDNEHSLVPEYLTTVDDIDLSKNEQTPISVSYAGWISVEDFIKYARKPYGEKFEVEI